MSNTFKIINPYDQTELIINGDMFFANKVFGSDGERLINIFCHYSPETGKYPYSNAMDVAPFDDPNNIPTGTVDSTMTLE